MLRILTDQERAEHRRELRHGLQPKGNNYKGKKDKPKVDGIGKGENKGLKGSAKWKGKKKRLTLSAKWKGKKKGLKIQKSVEDICPPLASGGVRLPEIVFGTRSPAASPNPST